MSSTANLSNQKKIVRILGQGQFSVDNDVLTSLNKIDDSIVKLLENNKNDDSIQPEFQNHLKLLETIVQQKGVAVSSKEIITSDIVLPGKDVTVQEARKVFNGEGIIKDMH